MYTLSEGSLETIMSGGHVEKPVMQILASKNIQGSDPIKRYRLLLSDGKHLHDFVLLPTQLNDKLTRGELCDFTIFRIDHFITSPLKDTGKKYVMIIVKVTVIVSGQEVGSKIGSPQLWTESYTPAATRTPSLQLAPKEIPVPSAALKRKLSGSNSQASASSMDTSIISTQMTHPIASLRPNENKVIKARVMSKTQNKLFTNGQGIYFKMNLCDESGEIHATAYNAECEKFYNIIQPGRVYFISRAQLKTANIQFCTLEHDCEIIFNSDTVVRECMEDSPDIPTIKYKFVPIGQISERNHDTILDVIGVCTSAMDVQMVTLRTGRPREKREVTLMDQSGSAITLKLWGSEAESFDANSNPVVCLKGARLEEFNGCKSLSCSFSTTMELNPDLPEAHNLREWFDNGGAAGRR